MGSISQDTAEMNRSVLALKDNVVMPVGVVLIAIEEHRVKGIEQNDPLIITQALSLKQLPITSFSMDAAVFVLTTHELPVNKDEIVSSLKRRLLLAGFPDAEVPLENLNSFTVRANKPSWKMDSLLMEEDLKKPQLLPVDDCEVGSTRKACKNCSCERAEAVEKVEKLGLTMDQIENPQSSCGSCGLGDAFRYGSCPYKGLPPFKLGEKVSLDGNFLAFDF
ncbi:hypothetical protein IFM89_011655 [Coptis chinensis]|uniref:Anamorsin C-terminal domain-containing protein n=1 Tax=Coptis chinensis TaxID=261450 RepID=A0A835HVH6_9MAGN|nr:hypothetical protein IFM89_011655 [Coptis chinensis]